MRSLDLAQSKSLECRSGAQVGERGGSAELSRKEVGLTGTVLISIQEVTGTVYVNFSDRKAVAIGKGTDGNWYPTLDFSRQAAKIGRFQQQEKISVECNHLFQYSHLSE